MSDKHLGRIENTGDSTKQQQQFSQPWTPQMMTPKLDLSGAGSKMPEEFGNFQLVDETGKAAQKSKPLEAGVEMRHQREPEHFQQNIAPGNDSRHAYQTLHTGASENQRTQPHVTKLQHNQPKEQVLSGHTDIPASMTPDGYRQSETLSTHFKRSDYREGEHFQQVLDVPAPKGKSNYYNGLAQAHFEHGHLYGVPVRMVNGQMTSHLDHEVDIPLHVGK